MDQLDILLQKLNRSDYRDEITESWKTKNEDGKFISINLSRLNLTELPENAFVGMEHLESIVLSHNQLTNLPDSVFDPVSSLKYLWLHNNELRSISNTIFSKLKELEWLYLNSNKIESIHSNAFRENSNLQDLRINRNRMSSLPETIFHGLDYLIILALHSCNITALPLMLFRDLKSVERIYLQNNLISDLDPKLLDLPSLQKIWVGGNRLKVDYEDPITKNQISKLIQSLQENQS